MYLEQDKPCCSKNLLPNTSSESLPSVVQDTEEEKYRRDSNYELNSFGTAREFNFNLVPDQFIQKVLSYLRYNEMKSLQAAVKVGKINDMMNYAEILLDKRLRKCSNFIWHRVFEEKKEEDRMAPRASHSIVYHEGEGAIYIFGGRVMCVRDTCIEVDIWEGKKNACFADLWKFDLTTKVLGRVHVTTTPYPLPKSGASMNVYKDEILLFGGRKPIVDRIVSMRSMASSPNTNEMHLFNTKTNSWKKFLSINEAPALFGHSAVICDDLLICYGGTLSQYALNTTFRVLDLKRLHWFIPNLPGVPHEFRVNGQERIATEFPIYGAETTSLIRLKPGHLLLLGENRPPNRRNVAVVVSYNRSNPEGQAWQWKVIPASGKWFEGARRLVGPSRHRNCDFAKVVPIYGNNFVRLVTVGLPKFYFSQEVTPPTGTPCFLPPTPRWDDVLPQGLNPDEVDVFVDGRCGFSAIVALTIIRRMQTKIGSYWSRKERSKNFPVDNSDDFIYEYQGIHVVVKDIPNKLRRIEKGHDMGTTCVEVWMDSKGEKFKGEFDCQWLASVLQRSIAWTLDFFTMEQKRELKNDSPKYSQRGCPFPNNIGILKNQSHLVSYTAFVSLDDDWTPDNLTEIRYEEGQSHPHCPPAFQNFALCAGRSEVFLHGGELQRDSMPHGIYIMICSPRENRTWPL